MASSSEEQLPPKIDEPSPKQSEPEPEPETDIVLHKTKTIQFFGRSSPVVLQNDNGPCPLLAICNVLLLRNQLNLNADGEVSQEKLLSLVAERLIDSNSNVNNKDAEYIKNQQQNISDAIDLLSRLTTGIDVNTKFRRIDDFEFTSECAIFDLLDIPLYHGWLVDPQDHDTAEAIGSKSYNTIMGDLVSLETRKMESEDKVDGDSVDFAAATAATLGVPSPSLLRAKSFEDSPLSGSDQHSPRKGDVEEAAELLRVLKMSEDETPSNNATTSVEEVSLSSDENSLMMKSSLDKHVNVTEESNHYGVSRLEPSGSGSADVSENCERSVPLEDHNAASTMRDDQETHNDQLTSAQPAEGYFPTDLLTPVEAAPLFTPIEETILVQKIESLSSPCVPDFTEEFQKQNGEHNETSVAVPTGSESSSGRVPSVEAVESFTSSLEGSEPIYEGEECILDSVKLTCEDREPVYEGEVVLAEQANKGSAGDACNGSPKDAMTLRQGELVSNFLKSNASQLTFYGLFSLQEGLKERELCVFFRNNHFSTMFKFEGELYLLATDQGYMNQPDLVWEKLNEVNGDTLFMTCNFKEFRLESSSNGTWDQQNAVASTADYLASVDTSSPDGSKMNSDLQLAIALQQQEFEQQPQSSQRNQPQQASSASSSRLITGPQVSRSSGKATTSSSTSKQDQKSKDKSSNCKIM